MGLVSCEYGGGMFPRSVVLVDLEICKITLDSFARTIPGHSKALH